MNQLRPYLDGLYLDQIDKKLVAKIASRSGVTNATRRQDMTAASQVLCLAAAKDWIEGNPFRIWDRGVIPEKRDPIKMPRLDEIDAVIEAAPGTFGEFLRTLQYTGMRMNAPKDELIQKICKALTLDADEAFAAARRLPPDLRPHAKSVVRLYRRLGNKE